MEYRRLGRTELEVSLLGVGGGYLSLRDLDEGTEIYRRAAELGVNYFDGRYGASSTMQRPVIRGDRERFVVGSKTAGTSRDDVLRRVDEDLAELDTEYVDVYFLRAYDQATVDAHFAPGGSVEGLLEARRQGTIRSLGLSGHSDLSALARGVETGLIDVVEFPMNIVRREALDVLVPACLKHDVGMVVMKPLNAGLAPAGVCLPWLANQPIHVMAAGVSTVEQLELDAALLDRHAVTLSPAESAEVERWRSKTDAETCRICAGACQPVCEKGLSIDWFLYHNVLHNELRRLGARGFLAFPFAPSVREQAQGAFLDTVARLRTCSRCGKCVDACPHGLPVMDLLERTKELELELLALMGRAGAGGG